MKSHLYIAGLISYVPKILLRKVLSCVFMLKSNTYFYFESLDSFGVQFYAG